MCCGKRRRAEKAKQLAALEASRLTQSMAQMRIQEPSRAAPQQDYAQPPAHGPMPPPYESDAVQGTRSTDDKEKETEADLAAPSHTPNTAVAAEPHHIRQNGGGHNANSIPWFAYADQKFAKKFAKMHRKRCVDAACWCRSPPPVLLGGPAAVY